MMRNSFFDLENGVDLYTSKYGNCKGILKLCLFLFVPEILQQIQDKINVDQVSFINEQSSAIWLDTCRQLMHKCFSPNKRISVKFVDNEGESEGAVDVGGPKQEFMRLVVKSAHDDSGIFIGPVGCRSLFPNVIGMCLRTIEMINSAN